MDDAQRAVVDAARDEAADGHWNEAFDLLSRADADGQLGAEDLPALGDIAYRAGHLDVTIEAWERAHVAGLAAGDADAAAVAAVRVALHLLFDTAMMAPVRGWSTRAERLLAGQDESAALAWLAVVRTYERFLSGDARNARHWARRAVEVGSRQDTAAAAVGLVAEARLLILDGEVVQGLALLDEAGAAALSGELDPLTTGIVFCELVCALQGLAQYDLAEEWTEAFERWSRTSAIGSLRGRCRVHRAEILTLRGSLDEAEQEVLAASEELRPYLRRELGWPLNVLGRIRLGKGDIDGAERSFLEAHRLGWDAQPGLSLVRLAQGDIIAACTSIREALERPVRVPSREAPPNTELQRAPMLEALVQIELAAGSVDRARAAADELQGVATRFHSKALGAAAVLARGRLLLAEGDAVGARGCLTDAVRIWNDVGAPHEAARARVLLAAALRLTGNEHEAELEARAAGAVLERQPEPIEPHGPQPNIFVREGDYWTVGFDGDTVRVRDLKGVRYLALLLAHPGREFHVLDLVATVSGAGSVSRPLLGDAGEMLDARAKDAYRRRLAEIEEDLEEAHSAGDAERAAQAEAERDFLVRELAGAVGLGGRDRRAASASERARAAVTRAIRTSLVRIAEHHPALGAHLNHAIRTGTYCTYDPDPRTPVVWTTLGGSRAPN